MAQIRERITTTRTGTDTTPQSVCVEPRDRSFNGDTAKIVALTFVYREVDEVGIAGSVKLGDRGQHARIRKATIGVIKPDTFTIDGKPILAVEIVSEQPTENMGLLGGHNTLENHRTDGVIAGKVDRRYTSAIPLIDLKEYANPTVRGRFGGRGHGYVGISDLSVGRLNGLDVISNASLGVDPPRSHIDHRRKLIVIKTAVAVKPDSGDLGPVSHLGLRRRNAQNQRSTSDERRKSEKRHGEEDAVQKLG